MMRTVSICIGISSTYIIAYAIIIDRLLRNWGIRLSNLILIPVISLALSLPAFADETDKQPSPTQTSPAPSDSPSDSDTPSDTDDSIESDVQLLDKEFSGYGNLLGYRNLLDRKFGLLLGVGQSSPSDDFHLELIYAPLKFLRLSLSISTTRRGNMFRGKRREFTSAAFHARHHLTVLPIFFSTVVGGTKGSIKGITDAKQDMSMEYDYRSTSIYGGLLVGAYYFWSFGLYLETTVAGFSYHQALNKKFTKDIDDEDLEQDLNDIIVGSKIFGLLNGGLNITIGYMF